MASVAEAKAIQLHTGRMLGYAEYGQADGRPLFYFHGHPGSRNEAQFLEDAAAQVGIRLIGVDRPGLGRSSYQAGRRILDWPDDICELADHLRIRTFGVVGLSAGCPYTLACAYKIPDRLTACSIVSGAAAVGLFVRFLSRWMPWLILPISRRMFADQARAEQSLDRFAARWPEPDRKCLSQPRIKSIIAASLAEGLSPGARGAALDGMLIAGDWGFALEKLTFAPIYLWHGELDDRVRMSAARILAERIPNCKATFYPQDSHFSTMINHTHEVAAALRGTD